MAIFTPPTTAAVRTEVNLVEEQVNPAYDLDDYNADIAGRITEETAYVEERLSGKFGAGNLTSLSANQLTLGTKAIELRAAASVFHVAGSLDERYKAEALDYERRAEALLSTLESSIGNAIEPLSGTSAFAVVPTRVDGYSAACGEYACEDSC